MRQVPADIAGGLPGECQDDKNGNGLQIRRFARYGGSMGEGRREKRSRSWNGLEKSVRFPGFR